MSDACCSDEAIVPQASSPAASRLTLTMAAAGAAIAVGAGLGWLGQDIGALAAYALAIVLTIPEPARRAWRSVRAQILDIHVLMVIAVAGALVLGEWLEAATVIWLFGEIGRAHV